MPSSASTIRSVSRRSCVGRVRRLGDHVDQAVRGAGQFRQASGGVAFHALGRAEKNGGHFEAGGGEQARGHHAVAAIVAAAAEHRDARARGKLLAREGRHGGRGRAHQLEGRNAEPLGGGAIAGLHLGGGENTHSIYRSASGLEQ